LTATAWNFVGLLADMVDQGVEHEGHSRTYFLHGTRWHRYADTRHMTLPDGPLERPVPPDRGRQHLPHQHDDRRG
jgi:hypothetical protein